MAKRKVHYGARAWYVDREYFVAGVRYYRLYRSEMLTDYYEEVPASECTFF